ncbi:putative odorant receptor 85e [Tribolium madens]|uniref:putative odorant receptor 85e n=1 Tax=Tribolium madens TaxID=41895 RepID=UPI001CF74DE1|nr:putative odorant receptor 85e [Tribolium madens]
MKKSSELSDKLVFYWTFNCIASSLMPTIASLLGGNKDLPMVVWYPYDPNKTPYFLLTYIWEIFCLSNLGLIYAVLDMVFPSIAIVLGQQFKILASNFKNNVYRALIDSEVSETIVQNFRKNLYKNSFPEEILHIMKTEEFQKNNVNYFKKNIKHHQQLLQYCDDINDILGIFLMGKVTAAIFNTLFMAFSLITAGNRAMIFGLGSYMISTSIELLIYTYSGQILTQNADIVGSLYESPWYMCDVYFQRTFHIVQMRASKIVTVKAGNYFTMSASSFITFMKSLGSYIALLKELTDRGK